MKTKRCGGCKTGKLGQVRALDSVKVGGHTFSARVAALQCGHCGEVYFDGPGLERFELRVAVELARAGEGTEEAMRFMRKAVGLRAAEFAHLVDVTPETVSRWENGRQSMDHRALAVLASVVIDRFEGRTTMLDTLRAFNQPRKLARRIEFSPRELAAL